MRTSNHITEILTTLRRGATAAILATDDLTKAAKVFEEWMRHRNDAVLERTLCSEYRMSAIRALLTEQYNELRTAGRIEMTPVSVIPDSSTPAREQWRPGLGVNQDLRPLAEVLNQALILNAFKVNGEPVGDCTVETVEHAAANNERDARFMRFLVSGLPLSGKIRDYHSDAEAEKLWQLAQTSSTTHTADRA